MTDRQTPPPVATPAWTRRRFLRAAGRCAVAAGTAPAIIIPGRAEASRKTLRILQWNHFVPAFDEWFKQVWVKEWERKHDTRVIVDNVGMSSINGRAKAEVAAGKGHDLVMFLRPPSMFEDHVVDMRDVYEECTRRYGKPIDLALKSTYNPKTDKYYGFSTSYVPDPVNYRKDLWDDVGVEPDTWDDIREGGRKIMRKHRIPMGLGLASELDSNMALRSIMGAFGASVQDAEGNVVLDSPQTLEALKFVKAMYRESMTDEVFTWDPSSNNRLLLAGRGSLALNAISITRTGENQKIPVADRIWLARSARGPVRRIGLQHLIDIYTIWEFASNVDGAKQFLVDYIGDFRKAFLASEFYNFPCFPETVPDLTDLIADDTKAVPTNKYQLFADVNDWTTNVGFPGNANAAIDELFSNWTLSSMFAEAATGNMTPRDAMTAANSEARRVFERWRLAGKV